MYATCDDSGNKYLVMESIVDYQKSDKAVSVSSQKVVHRGWIFMQRSTFRWQLCIQWRDRLTSCQVLKDMKESPPVETAEYAVDQEIYHELALNWLVNVVLKKSLSIISLF